MKLVFSHKPGVRSCEVANIDQAKDIVDALIAAEILTDRWTVREADALDKTKGRRADLFMTERAPVRRAS